jgi:hypothetical protein
MLSRGARWGDPGRCQAAAIPAWTGGLVVLRGDIQHKNLWVNDLTTGSWRQLTNFGREFVIGDFDVSPDGREVVFERVQETSDVMMIDRAPR